MTWHGSMHNGTTCSHILEVCWFQGTQSHWQVWHVTMCKCKSTMCNWIEATFIKSPQQSEKGRMRRNNLWKNCQVKSFALCTGDTTQCRSFTRSVHFARCIFFGKQINKVELEHLKDDKTKSEVWKCFFNIDTWGGVQFVRLRNWIWKCFLFVVPPN